VEVMMKKVPLGTSGEQVSSLCLGAMFFGTKQDRDLSFRLLDQYIEAGGSFIDTANIYAHWVEGCQGGESEAVLGEWMRERRNRQDLFLATKVGFELPGTPRSLKAAQIELEIDRSLRRLGVEMVDLYYAHVDDRSILLEETLEAFDRLVRAGKVRRLGASNYLAWRLEEASWVSQAHHWAGFCCIQQRYTYLYPRPGASFYPQIAANDDLLDYVKSRGLTLLAYSPLLAGAYTRPDRPLPDEYRGANEGARLSALRSVAAECGASMNQVILAWMVQNSPAVIPVFAASSPAQMAEDLNSLDLHLTPEQMAKLNSAN
jgi:aryl-alcohol dehydrogenase-like predicted oxidoreductase